MERDEVHTTIVVPARVWLALRALAELAGSPNVSGVVVDLVEDELRRKNKAPKRA